MVFETCEVVELTHSMSMGSTTESGLSSLSIWVVIPVTLVTIMTNLIKYDLC